MFLNLPVSKIYYLFCCKKVEHPFFFLVSFFTSTSYAISYTLNNIKILSWSHIFWPFFFLGGRLFSILRSILGHLCRPFCTLPPKSRTSLFTQSLFLQTQQEENSQPRIYACGERGRTEKGRSTLFSPKLRKRRNRFFSFSRILIERVGRKDL